MDSGNNSGSMQSSSGDEGYDSRPESAAAAPPPPPAAVFFNPHLYQNELPPPPPAFFDIPSLNNKYLHPVSQYKSSSSFLNLDMVGSRTNKNLQDSSSSSLSIARAGQRQGLIKQGSFSSSSSSSMQSRFLNNNEQTNVVKNPKKRTRTSRRAPTTVLTTDTSNFRSMVQEFTGIPAQPFSVIGSPPYSRRLDLFKSGNYPEPLMEPLMNRPLRPPTQMFQPIPAFVSSSIDATTASTLTTTIKEPQNMMNNFMQQNLNHPLVSFRSLLQHSNLNPSPSLSFGVTSFEDPHHHHDLAMSHAHEGLPNQDHHSKPFEGNFGNSL